MTRGVPLEANLDEEPLRQDHSAREGRMISAAAGKRPVHYKDPLDLTNTAGQQIYALITFAHIEATISFLHIKLCTIASSQTHYERATNMAPRHHFATEIPQSIFEEEDTFDDSMSGVPVPTMTVPQELSRRFIRRLAKLTAASVNMQEERMGGSAEIIMSRNSGSPQARIELDTELNKFLASLKDSLEIISQRRQGNAFEQAKEELMDSILMFSFLNIEHVVQSLQRLFKDNDNEYSELVTHMLGINAQQGTTTDSEVGDAVIKLQQLTQSYNKSPRQLHILIQTAAGMINRITHIQDRLRYLLRRPKFSNELYRLICTLGTPERARETFVRTAQTSQSFRRIKITTRPNPPSPTRVRFSPSPPPRRTSVVTSPSRSALRRLSPGARSTASTAPTPARSAAPANAIDLPAPAPQRQPEQPLIEIDEDTPLCSPSTSTASSASGSTMALANPMPQSVQETRSTIPRSSRASRSRDLDIYAVVRLYLSEGDRDVGIARLQPAVKQEVAQLAAAVLRCNLVPVKARIWSTFGFVTVKNEEEERHLAGLYAAILEEAVDKQWIFQEVMQAAETNTLPQLFDRNDYGHFRQEFPRLELFLSTPPIQRPTVWNLKHFLQDEDNTEPPAVLQRDYGFRYCRLREEVARLKAIYSAILKNADAMSLHHACEHGRLVQFAAQKGIFVDAKDKRLMQNDYPAPFIGYDNGLGLTAYRGPFFRRHL